jgi:Protein of unknown function (DUF3592)
MQVTNHTFGLYILSITFCVFLYIMWCLVRSYQSRYWPKAKGRILESKAGDGYKMTYDLIVLYAYIVNGHQYTSNSLHFGPSSRKDWNSVQKDILRYAPGKTVSVYYNPHKPSDAVLDRNVSIWTTLFFMFWISFTSFFGVSLLMSKVK